MNLRKLLEAGHAELSRQHNEQAADKAGHPRIGSIGIVTEDGNVHGVCHRVALARSLGLEKSADLSTDLMWKMGEANEYHWERIITAAISAGPTDPTRWPVKMLKHDEVAIKAPIDGVPLEVLGHPDVVLDFGSDEQLGLELKGIFGYTTAVQVHFERRPKNENLIQAAGYSYFKQIPYALCYTLGSYVKLNFYDAKKHGIKSLRPFYHIFYMEWRNDVLFYRSEFETEWIGTLITPKAIEDYYRLQEVMKTTKNLGQRVNADYVDGTPNKWGRDGQCGLCEFKTACDRYDRFGSYDNWIDDVKHLVSSEAEPE